MPKEHEKKDHLFMELKVLNDILSGLINAKSRKKQGGNLTGRERNFIDVVLDAAGALIVVYDEKGRILCFNRACEEATGFTFNDVVGRFVWDTLVATKDAESIRSAFDKLDVGQFPKKSETHWVTRGGNNRLIAWENTPLSEGGGKEGHVIGIGIDLTEKKQLERTLRESEEKYRRLIETANDAIFLADADTGIILDANKKAAELIGLPVEKIIGKHQSELHPKEKTFQYRSILQEAVRTGGGIARNLDVSHVDGHRIPVDISASVTEIGEKKVILGIFRDISERKKMEEGHLRIQKLESAGLLAGGIAHKLDQLLTGILSNIEGGKMVPGDDEKAREILSEAENLTLRAKKLIRNFLTITTDKDQMTKDSLHPEGY